VFNVIRVKITEADAYFYILYVFIHFLSKAYNSWHMCWKKAYSSSSDHSR